MKLKRKLIKLAQPPLPGLKRVQVKLLPIPHAGEITMTFHGSDTVRAVKEGFVAKVADSEHVIFVRLKFCPTEKQSAVSKDSKPVFLMWHGGAALAHIEERGTWQLTDRATDSQQTAND